jgi:hypothetical protein
MTVLTGTHAHRDANTVAKATAYVTKNATLKAANMIVETALSQTTVQRGVYILKSEMEYVNPLVMLEDASLMMETVLIV